MISVEAVGSVVRVEVAGCKVDLTIGEARSLSMRLDGAIDRGVDARIAASFAAAETPTTDAPSLGIDAGSGGMSPGSPLGHRPAGGPSVEEDASRGSARVSGGRP